MGEAENDIQHAVVAYRSRQVLDMPEGFLQGRNGLRMGVAAGGFLSKARQVLDGFARLVRPRIMMRQAIIHFLQTIGIERFQGLPCCRMQDPSLGGNEALVGHVLSQGVFEDIHRLLSTAPLVEELQPLEFQEMWLQSAWLLPEHVEKR